jgi:DNA-binding NarL/FixJ family response regulator
MPTIRILLADDHLLFRQGLKRLLIEHSDFEIAAEAATGQEVIDALGDHPVDVAILDLSMPGVEGADLVSRVKALHPCVKTLVMTMHGEETYVMQALRAGTEGYMTKENAAEELVLAIRKLAAGGKYVCPAVAERLTFSFSAEPSGKPRHASLSPREFRVFEMLVAGRRGSEIAQELQVSEKTVSTHKAHLLRKMNLGNQAELVLYAVKHRLVTM